MDHTIDMTWHSVSRAKVEAREKTLSRFAEWRLPQKISPQIKSVVDVPRAALDAREWEIVQLDATSLANSVKERHFTCLEVMNAYCHAAVLAQDLTNCLTEIFFDEAIERAKELDAYMEAHNAPVGPLHGVPISVKDHIKVAGKDTSTGYVAWCFKTVAQEDAVVVDILRKAGAMIYVKTNNPQTLLALETNNNIYGRTNSPFDLSRTPGGSSGGESALICLHGSAMGIGTDIGGSIRLPAACTGLYGFKGSVARLPHKGLLGSHDGMDAIVGCLGPIARSARDLGLFCRVMDKYEPWLLESALLEIPWRHNVEQGLTLPAKLSFAFLWDDGVVAPEKAILEELRRCKDRLLAAGHTVIDWDPLQHKEAWDLIKCLYFLDGGKEYFDVLAESGEPPVEQTKWILNQIPNGRKPFSIAEIFRLNLDREAFRQRLLEHWNATSLRTGSGRPVDGIISPVAPTLAPKHDGTSWWGYTSYWNLADYPAAVFPVGMKELLTDESSVRLPVCLQIIGRRLNEEKTLAMLNVVDSLCKVEGEE